MLAILDPKWQLFVKVAQLGSLSKTSVALDMQQSVVSRHMALLERECGTRLFRRTGRGVVLTEFGQQIFPRISAMLAAAETLADDIRTSGGVPFGEVRVGLLPSSVPIMAGPLFSTIQAKFPKVRLHLMEGNSAQLEEQLGEGRLDMALLLREGEPTLSSDEPVLARLNLHVVASADAPLMQQDQVAFDDLQNLPLILPSPPHPLRARLAEIAQTRQVALDMAIEADSIRLQHAIAAEGGGYAITAGLSNAMTSGGNLVSREITQPSLLRCIVLGTTLRRPHTLATRAVYQLIQQLGSTRLQNGPGAV